MAKFKVCRNCALLSECKPRDEGHTCLTWVPKTATCRYCKHLRACLLEGTSIAKVCKRFKRNPTPPDSVDEVRAELSLHQDEQELFSPVALVEKILKSDFDYRHLDVIDDGDIPKAPNSVEFITNHDFMGLDLFPRQLVTVIDFFGDACPWCSNLKWIKNKVKVDTPVTEILDRVELFHHGVCPKCKRTRYQAYKEEKLRPYNQLIGVAGQRSGKSALTAIMSAAITHKYLKLNAPQETFGLLLNSTFHGTFVSLNYGQAHDNLWQPYYELLTSTKWFRDYFEFLDTLSQKSSRELFKLRDTFVIWSHKSLTVYPSGPDKRKLRGRTRFLSSVDEIAWFFGGGDVGDARSSQAGIKYNPDEVYKALNNSLITLLSASKRAISRNPDLPTAYGIYISSPRSRTDKSMRMLSQSRGSNSIYGFHFATWEFNPNIQKEDLSEEYRTDPIGAERDFGANPPHSSAPFISSTSAVSELFTKRKNYFEPPIYKVVEDSLGNKLLSPRLKIKRVHSHPSILSIDCGHTNNSFACTLLHKEDEEIFRLSGVIELIPDHYPLSFPDIYEYVISPIIENFDVRMVTFDRWQSISLSQQIFKDFDIDALRYSLTYQDFENCREDILSGNFKFPRLEHPLDSLLSPEIDVSSLIDRAPVSHFFLQLLMVKDTGRTVTKGDEVTDDIFRSFVVGHAVMTHEDHADLFEVRGSDLPTRQNISDMVVVVGASSIRPGSSPVSSSLGSIAGGSSLGNFRSTR